MFQSFVLFNSLWTDDALGQLRSIFFGWNHQSRVQLMWCFPYFLWRSFKKVCLLHCFFHVFVYLQIPFCHGKGSFFHRCTFELNGHRPHSYPCHSHGHPRHRRAAWRALAVSLRTARAAVAQYLRAAAWRRMRCVRWWWRLGMVGGW